MFLACDAEQGYPGVAPSRVALSVLIQALGGYLACSTMPVACFTVFLACSMSFYALDMFCHVLSVSQRVHLATSDNRDTARGKVDDLMMTQGLHTEPLPPFHVLSMSLACASMFLACPNAPSTPPNVPFLLPITRKTPRRSELRMQDPHTGLPAPHTRA